MNSARLSIRRHGLNAVLMMPTCPAYANETGNQFGNSLSNRQPISEKDWKLANGNRQHGHRPLVEVEVVVTGK